jgi:hypothetical protein
MLITSLHLWNKLMVHSSLLTDDNAAQLALLVGAVKKESGHQHYRLFLHHHYECWLRPWFLHIQVNPNPETSDQHFQQF